MKLRNALELPAPKKYNFESEVAKKIEEAIQQGETSITFMSLGEKETEILRSKGYKCVNVPGVHFAPPHSVISW